VATSKKQAKPQKKPATKSAPKPTPKKKAVAHPRPADWSELGKYGAPMRSIETSLASMNRVDLHTKGSIERAVALLAESPNRPQRAKDVLTKAYVDLDVEVCRAAACATTVIVLNVPLFVDESSVQTRAHRACSAHNEEYMRLLRVKFSLQRTTFGDGAQVANAVAEMLKFWTVERAPEQVSVPISLVAPETFQIGESLLAVAETGSVYSTGACACSHDLSRTVPPSTIQFDRQGIDGMGAPTLVRESSVDLSSDMAASFLDRKACLPWVRITRDPRRFGECAKAAAAVGQVHDAKTVFEVLGPTLAREDQEVFVVILLDVQMKVRAFSEIARGARDRADVPIPDVLRIALVDGASYVIVVHNHPSGNVEPSESDIHLTKELKRAFETVRIALLDHVILGHSKFYSFADHKQI
jgi:hypothetical protein